jgi:hypothetical protein
VCRVTDYSYATRGHNCALPTPLRRKYIWRVRFRYCRAPLNIGFITFLFSARCVKSLDRAQPEYLRYTIWCAITFTCVLLRTCIVHMTEAAEYFY